MMINLHAIDFSGIVTAITGNGGVLTAGQACQKALAVPQVGAMIFIVLVAMGVWIKLLDTTVAGGANG